MAFSRTWDVDRANYNAATERAMDKIEAQAATQWSVGANNTWKQANPWVCSGTTRVFGTLYKNNTSNPVLVMASIDVQGVQNALGSGAASASIEVYNSAGTLLYEVGQVGSSATTVVLSTVDFFSQLFTIVNPTEQYKLVDTRGSGTGVISIVTVFEFQFDAKYTAQNWAHLEQLATAKLNTYAAGVNRIPPKDEAFAYGSSGTVAAGASEVMNDRVTLELYDYAVSYFNILTGTGGARTFDLKNSGGSALQVAKLGAILGGAAEIGGGVFMGAVVSNAGGTIHNAQTGTGGTLTSRMIEFVAPSYSDVVFRGPALLLDSSGNDNSLTASGGAPTVISPSPFGSQFGTAINLASTSQTLAATSTPASISSFTVSGFFRPDSSDLNRVLFTLPGSMSIETNSTSYRYIFQTAAGGGALTGSTVVSGTPIHLEFSYDSATGIARYFENGVMTSFSLTASPIISPTGPFRFGQAGFTATGDYDDWQFDSGVIRHTSSFTPPSAPNGSSDDKTLAAWHFDSSGLGESGVAVGNKFRALDLRASRGANTGSAMTHTTVTVGSPTTIASISTGWRIVTVAASFSALLTSNANCDVAINGTNIFTIQNTSLGNTGFKSMGLFLLPAGSSATITATGTMTIDRIHTWTVV